MNACVLNQHPSGTVAVNPAYVKAVVPANAQGGNGAPSAPLVGTVAVVLVDGQVIAAKGTIESVAAALNAEPTSGGLIK